MEKTGVALKIAARLIWNGACTRAIEAFSRLLRFRDRERCSTPRAHGTDLVW